MPNFIAIETATGDVYCLKAKDTRSAYIQIAKEVLKMEVQDPSTFDTGNVDVDLYALGVVPAHPTKLNTAN